MLKDRKNNLFTGVIKGLRIIGNIQSQILLTVVYFSLLLPIGILTRLFSNSLTAKPKDRCRSSYWKAGQEIMGDDCLKFGRRQY
ncbi:MAG: hypothetical protein HYS56_05040 [Candidatus Omnitrophica bacterium]|nr:hypothetical protein [Candidatus Omnitrophota bacterium]